MARPRHAFDQVDFFPSLDQAQAAFHERLEVDPTTQVWAQTKDAEGAKRFPVGPFSRLYEMLEGMPRKIGDEYYFAREPCRLFFDLDGAGMTKAAMDAFVMEIDLKVRAAVAKRFGEMLIQLHELDGSRDGKQSRHLFFDPVIFASMTDMRRFIQADISPGLSSKIDGNVYLGERRCLRLPLCFKFDPGDGNAPMRPKFRGVPFDFARNMVNELPAHRPENLLTMPSPQEVAQVGPVGPVQRIRKFLARYKVEEKENTMERYHAVVRGVRCPVHGKAHEKNGATFTLVYGRDKLGRQCVGSACFQCLDDDCARAKWSPKYSLEYVIFPDNSSATW
jgi:hypothetical protein